MYDEASSLGAMAAVGRCTLVRATCARAHGMATTWCSHEIEPGASHCSPCQVERLSHFGQLPEPPDKSVMRRIDSLPLSCVRRQDPAMVLRDSLSLRPRTDLSGVPEQSSSSHRLHGCLGSRANVDLQRSGSDIYLPAHWVSLASLFTTRTFSTDLSSRKFLGEEVIMAKFAATRRCPFRGR